MLIILWDVKELTHYSNKSRVIPVLWLSSVCEWGVGEVGHLVRDLGVLLCPFPLGNKSCPVKWTKSKSNGMQFTNCTTRKPLFHESYGSWTCIYTPSPSNDMQFTNCTTRKPLFHDPYESHGSWTCIYTPSPSNDMQFTNCTTRKPLFNDPYESYGSWTCI